MANEEWVYIATNGWLLRQELADRLGDAGALFNFELDSWLFWPNCSCLQASIALHRGTGGDEYERVKTLPLGLRSSRPHRNLIYRWSSSPTKAYTGRSGRCS